MVSRANCEHCNFGKNQLQDYLQCYSKVQEELDLTLYFADAYYYGKGEVMKTPVVFYVSFTQRKQI